jgi:hypothetical protein
VRLRPRSESSATEGAAGEGAGAAAGWRDTPRQDGDSGPLHEESAAREGGDRASRNARSAARSVEAGAAGWGADARRRRRTTKVARRWWGRRVAVGMVVVVAGWA